MFAEVIVDILNSEVDRVFDYKILSDNAAVGSRVIIPFGNRKTYGIIIKIKETSAYAEEKIKPIIAVLDDMPALTKESLSLVEYVTKKYYVPKALALRLFLPNEMRKGVVKESLKKYLSYDGANLAEELSCLRKSAVKQKDALLFLAEKGKEELTVMAENFGRAAVMSLAEKGVFKITEEQVTRTPYQNLKQNDKNITLLQQQLSAIKSIDETNKTVSLLFGVTGSGKTEVYLNKIRSVLAEGKSAIMLVPEIALTPQMLRELRQKFGDNCAILHSGLTAGERFDEWWRLRRGGAKIAVGARSAIFAPLENLGLIIIDEEHDASYQSESAPRYITLELALARAKFNNAKVVLGSATPSVDSYLKAVNGEYNLITMPNRINARALPEVEIVDMKKEVRRGNNSSFSSLLKAEIKEALDGKKQVIIFLNQRGYSKNVICTECGYTPKCEACDVSLTYHSDEGALKCHYCNAKYKMITACPNCGSKFLRYGGIGTERVVAELYKLFPTARILRMDRDTTENKEGHFKILEKFSAREADILVGTQMVAKGHDFSAVTLVGIIDADMSLHFSDYRSNERTFQLITQVSGRSGRANDIGKVVLQTYMPENNVINYAVGYDYKNFFEYEIALRKATAFPPFTDIVRILLSGEDETKTLATLKNLYEEIKEIYDANKNSFRYFGCMKAPIKRLQNKFRYQILMRINVNSPLTDIICNLAVKNKDKAVFISPEINPNSLT